MFSSLNSLLPSVLHSTRSQPAPAPMSMDAEEEDDEQREPNTRNIDAKYDGNEAGGRDTSKDRKVQATESFIFVRPPPAMSNHPLNLQVQLLPPNTPAPTGVDPDSDTVVDVPLARTSSNYSSSSAVSSTSLSSSASGRRKIVPLYNLRAHNVLTNTIVDAGTDAKIAKFTRRGLEMVGLAGMEVVEVWAANANAGVVMAQMVRRPTLETRASGGSGLSNTPSPASSALSLSSVGSHLPPPSLEPGKKKRDNLFGRMFKKRPDNSVSPVAIPEIPSTIPSEPPTPGLSEAPSPQGTQPQTARNARYLSAPAPYIPQKLSPSPSLTSSSSKRVSLSMDCPSVADIPQLVFLPPTLGIQPQLNISVPSDPSIYGSLVQLFTRNAYPPTFSAGGNPFVGRGPAMYVWTVRRWMKGSGVLTELLSGGRVPPSGDGVEVRVEWRRGKGKKSVRAQAPLEKRTSISSKRRSMSRVRQPTVVLDEAGDGEESDPEDSETPWACTIRVKRISPSAASTPTSSVGSTMSSSTVRVKVGTLSPTPHHPKVVAMLKVPFPLPDIEVDRVRVVKRKLVTDSSDGRMMVSSDPLSGLVFTGDEIKDVVCSTGLWLVVREGFGGVGKVSRKGDGWRIRA